MVLLRAVSLLIRCQFQRMCVSCINLSNLQLCIVLRKSAYMPLQSIYERLAYRLVVHTNTTNSITMLGTTVCSLSLSLSLSLSRYILNHTSEL